MALTGTFSYDPSSYVTAATNWANEQKARGDTEYQWAKDQFAKNAATSDNVVGAALKQGNYWDDASKAGLDQYQRLYPQAMEEQLNYARNYATPEQLAYHRGRAVADVGQAFDAQAKEAKDQLESYGLKPQDVASRLDSSVRTQRAAASVAAGNQSDINREVVGQQLLGQAINTGMQGAQLASQQAGVAQAARNQAVNTGLATTASGSSTRGTPLQWTGMANEELKEWPKTQQASYQMANDFYANQDKSQQAWAQQAAGQSSGIGAAIGGLGAIAKNFGPLLMGANTGGVIHSFEDGGVMHFDDGGAVPTPGMPPQAIDTGAVVPQGAGVPGIPGPDKVPALMQEGEGVVPLDVMRWIGEAGFQKFIEKARKDMQRPQQAEGEPAPPDAAAMAKQAGPQFASEGAVA